jgi:2-polyprenyl-6-hydroxyphenyl methylase/3-demethylubiquinone-9 3-methyltransferase
VGGVMEITDRESYQKFYDEQIASNIHLTSQWARVNWMLPYVKGSVLEVGCQSGGMTKILGTHTDSTSILTIDITDENVKKTQETVQEINDLLPMPLIDVEADTGGSTFTFGQKILVQKAYIEDILGSELFDTIILAEVLEHVLSPEDVLKSCDRLLAPGGTILITVPYEDATPSPDHLRTYTLESFYKELEVLQNGIKYVTIVVH